METVTFLSFTSGVYPDERDHYETVLYAVCYQGYPESYALGIPIVSEIGILSRTGFVDSLFLDHYKVLLAGLSGQVNLPDEIVLKPISNC
jgi:hypothetical protein